MIGGGAILSGRACERGLISEFQIFKSLIFEVFFDLCFIFFIWISSRKNRFLPVVFHRTEPFNPNPDKKETFYVTKKSGKKRKIDTWVEKYPENQTLEHRIKKRIYPPYNDKLINVIMELPKFSPLAGSA